MNETRVRQTASDANPDALKDHLEISVRNIGIPPRPAVLVEIDAEMKRSDPDYKRINEIIGADVGLAAAVIKVANSSYFGMGRRVRNVTDALLVLGLRLTVHTIAGIILQRVFPKVPSLDHFWDSSARVAHMSRWLAQQLKKQTSVHPDDAYTCGLFRDCGIPLIMAPFPEYADVLKRANAERERASTDIEDEAMAINHATFGAELAEEWGLPEETCQAIRHHHDRNALAGLGADPLPPGARALIGITQLAEHMTQSPSGPGASFEWEKLGAASLEALGIDPERLAGLERDAASAMTAAT
jgi:HD-like signal output (HDOD) protein